MKGHYLSTVYVTHKIATQSWQFSGGNRRKEALPHWCYQRGVESEDGLYLPTKKSPLVDGITGATPQGASGIEITRLANEIRKSVFMKFGIWIEPEVYVI